MSVAFWVLPVVFVLLGSLGLMLFFWRQGVARQAEHTGQITSLTGQLRQEQQAARARQQELEELRRTSAVQEEQLRHFSQQQQEYKETQDKVNALTAEIARHAEHAGADRATIHAQQEELEEKKQEILRLNETHNLLTQDRQDLTAQVAEQKKELEAEKKQSGEKLALLENARKELTTQFSQLASEILEDKSRRFTRQNQENLTQLLTPLHTRLKTFQEQVEKTYDKESRDRAGLTAQVDQLVKAHKRLSDEASNLTRALKGESQTRGSWGETILEKLLEDAGLQKGREYTKQESQTQHDGTRLQADIIIHLPENKHLIIDSKVTLNAYLDYTEAQEEKSREAALKRHILAVKKQINDLSAKQYQNMYGAQSLDCVILFIPIEPAFMLAIAHDPDIWHEAWKKNILLVSSTTLLFVLRIVAHLWRQEDQQHNVQKIVERGERLYDKFVGFVEDMETIGRHISQTGRAYDSAHKKLSKGAGNLIGQAEKLKKLGLKSHKTLPEEMVQEALDESSKASGNNELQA